MKAVNLSRRPFVNTRPVLRASVLLWLIGAVFLVVNAWLYLGFWRGSAEIRGELTAVNNEIRQEQDHLSELESRLGKLQLIEQNVQVEFLNRLIAYRTFPWSSLFDQLVDVLPADVRLLTVQPEVRLGSEDLARARARKRRAAIQQRRQNQRSAQQSADRQRTAERRRAEPKRSSTDEVALRLYGVAKTDDALFQFVDELFASPVFEEPVLERENRDPNNGLLTFSLDVIYLTGGQLPEEDTGEEGGDEPVVASVEEDRDDPAVAGVEEDRDDPGIVARKEPVADDDEEEEDEDAEEQQADVATGRLLNPSAASPPEREEAATSSPVVSSRPQIPSRSAPDRPSPRPSTVRPAPGTRFIPPSGQVPRTGTSTAPGASRPGTAPPRAPRDTQDVDEREERRPMTPLPLKPDASATPRLRRGAALWPSAPAFRWTVSGQAQEVSS